MRRLAMTWGCELLAVLAAWLLLCAALARGQGWQSGPCPSGGCGVNLGLGLGLGLGGWRNGPGQAPQPRAPPSAEPAPTQAVRIANALPGQTNYATGAFVACGDVAVVLTCRHTFREGVGTITVMTANGAKSCATLIAMDPSQDLAALSVAPCPARPLIVATEYPRQGETVSGGGFGANGQWVWITGKCRGFVALDRSSRTALSFTFKGGAREGDSGGPVLNQRGELVGVLYATDGCETVAVYCGRVSAFLASLPAKGKPAAPGAKDVPLAGVPIPGAAPPVCDCSPVLAKIDAMAKASAEQRAASDKRIEAVAAAIARQSVAAGERSLDLQALSQAAGALTKIPAEIAAVKTAVESQQTTIQNQASAVTEVHQAVAAVPDAIGTAAAATGRTALWTALLGALGVGGPAGVGLAIGMRLLCRAIDRRRETAETTQQPIATPQRPAEPIVDRKVITAPVPTAHERALQAAVDEYAKRYPGGGALIQSLTSQFESGNLGALR